jgi:trans-aconitate methyltransferase
MNHAAYFADSFNRHVKWYEENITPLTIYNESYDALIARMSPNAKLLDVGCGPANVSEYIRKHLPEISVTGIDLAPEMIFHAKRNIPDGFFHVMDIRDISQLKEVFDVVVLGFCIPYLSDDEIVSLLRDINKLMNSEGTIYMSYIEAISTTPFNSAEPVMRKHDRATIASYLQQAGLKSVSQFSSSYTNSQGNAETHIARLIKSQQYRSK